MRFQFSIIIIVFMLCAITTQSTSKYEGVSWNEKRKLWQTTFDINGKVRKFYFDNEFDAAKKFKQLCEKMKIPPQNPEICELPNQQKNEKKSQYKGVFWQRERRNWVTRLQVKQKKLYGGIFKDELNAAKRVNQICEELEIPLQNPEISTIPNQQYEEKKKTSQYKGVFWHRERGTWYVLISPKEQKQKYGGYFNDVLDAAKRVNQLCEELGIPLQNPEISAMPNQQYQKKEKTSQYKGVYWQTQRRKWYVRIYLKGQKQKNGGHFEDELEAAKGVNQLCEEFGIPLQNPEISAIPNQQYQKREKTSQYKGVTWNKQTRKWRVQLSLKGEKPKCGGYFEDELDAAKEVNQLCEEMEIPLQNPAISAIPNQKYQKKEKTSQYKGVGWHKKGKKWFVLIRLKGQKRKYGGMFNDELDAAKGVNQLCEELGIPLQNPKISAIPNQKYERKKKTSQYKGVFWNRKGGKWFVLIHPKGQTPKYGGMFEDEQDAVKRVNQLCEELGIPLKNPEISAIPNQPYRIKQMKSRYKGVSWHKKTRKWRVQLSIKGEKQKTGGYFNDELEAGKRVNQLCEELGIPLRNPKISAIPNQQYQKNCKTLLDHDTMQAEFQCLIKILDENNDPTTHVIKKILILTINYREQTIMTDITLRTKNGESALSIAAKYGFSNIVKFLISKGAQKEHFTNDHHTPLSLAVSQNHLKVVQVLFEDWISPNSHEKPYLHLSPIFQVKSREIAQLLIDNDAVTHDIYNDKNQSPLTVACQNGYLDVVEFFLDDELDINHLDSDDRTPLFYALTNKHHDVSHLLISKGAQNRFLPRKSDESSGQNQKFIMPKYKY